MDKKIFRGNSRIYFISVLVVSALLVLSSCSVLAKLKTELWDKTLPDKTIDQPHKRPVNNPPINNP